MSTRPPTLNLPPVRPSVEDLAALRARARSRIRIVGALLALGMAAVGARGVQLAVDPDPRTLSIATDKRWASVTTQGERGTIVDAEGNVLAKSVKHPAIFVDPVAVREQETSPWGGMPVTTIAQHLATLLQRPEDEILAVLQGPGRYVRLARGVHPEVADRIRDLRLTEYGVIIEENYRRFYPQGTTAAQLVGFVDDSGRGRQGLERWFDEELTGAEIVSQHRINRWGRVLELWRRDDRRAGGHTVHTTIDRVVQRAAEAALEQVMERHEPLGATAVVVEVATGRILAIANAPAFDPNHVGSLAPDDFGRTRNLAVMAAVEPGSVFKPFTLAAGIEAGVVKIDDMLDTTSPLLVGDARIRDDHPHPRMTAAEMIKYSSNVGAAKVGLALGEERLMATFALFGFGTRTGIETQGEAAGVRGPRGHFGPVELATVSFGQGITATALQLAMATAAIANDGVRMKPIIVDRITDAYGTEVRSWEPSVAARVVSPETARDVNAAMRLVVEPGGTGTRAAIPGYLVAGKTGTAQKVKNGVYSAARYATFIGFAPADRPVLAMAVIVDEPTVGSRYGGVVAAPVFAEVMGAALRRLGVPPDPALLGTTPTPPADDALASAEPVEIVWSGDGWRMPDLRGVSLRDVLVGLQGTGIRLDVAGSGALVAQSPEPGRIVRPGDLVHLAFD